MLLGPTHEEEVTQLVAAEVRSYRQLPLRLYQSSTAACPSPPLGWGRRGRPWPSPLTCEGSAQV
jgi:hypothetical protein